MTKTKKIVLSVAVLAMVIALSVGMTLAYLTSTPDAVTNTFTVGKVEITLDEAKVNDLGEAATPASRVTENTYKLLPGHEYVKDPTIHVAEGSEDCWLFVKVDDQIAAIEDETTVAAQLEANGWTAVAGAENVYSYKETVSAEEDVVVFEAFKVKGDAEVADYNGKTIVVNAYAVQADGFDTAAAAWTAAPASWTATAADPEDPAGN